MSTPRFPGLIRVMSRRDARALAGEAAAIALAIPDPARSPRGLPVDRQSPITTRSSDLLPKRRPLPEQSRQPLPQPHIAEVGHRPSAAVPSRTAPAVTMPRRSPPAVGPLRRAVEAGDYGTNRRPHQRVKEAIASLRFSYHGDKTGRRRRHRMRRGQSSYLRRRGRIDESFVEVRESECQHKSTAPAALTSAERRREPTPRPNGISC